MNRPTTQQTTEAAAAGPTAPAATEHTVIDSPIGLLTLVTDGTSLTGLYMEDHRHAPVDRGPERSGADVPPVLQEAAAQLTAYFDGQRTTFDLPLAARGTAFQQRVWALLPTIPYGRTATYGELAKELGSPGASRAVGLANGRNPISIVVPCHRVVGASGALTGYGGGIERKQALLALEQGGEGQLW